ncbi:MAG: AMP-binding protein [Bryobacteraceae bacterium]|nr:AMP-binding protein [Bryobacteraceae bacterium]MDW8379913.1 AMP-binding protein [Bryobacterales bacterium]
MNLSQLFELSLRGRRDSPALESGDQRFTFGELAARAAKMAHLLRQRGLQPGDRLCVYLANCVEVIDLYLACVQLGVIYVPINILYRDREISHIVADAEPKAVVSRQVLDKAVLQGALLWRPDELVAEAAKFPGHFPAEPLEGDTPAAIVYTSGTTGAAKGAVLTHNNFLVNAVNLLACWQITDKDRLLLPLPLFHVHGLGNGLHCWLASGCLLRLLERFDHQRAVEEFLDFEPTVFFAVPTIYVRLLMAPQEAARRIGSRMRLFVSGSAPLPPQIFEDFQIRFGHAILERYGMTETLMNTSNPYVGERRPATVGIPLPGVSLRVCDPNGKDLPPQVSGELYVRGPNVFAGYWRNREATAAAFQEGWFRTGDMGFRSADGYYTIEGRKSDLIICGGFNVYPREIEDFLEQQPQVAEAAVVGVADPVKGEVPVAYLVARGPINLEALAQECRRHLASFKMPRSFIVVERLPRNALGKVQKHLLVPDPAQAERKVFRS